MKKEIIEIQVKGTGESVKSVDKLKGSISDTKKETKDFGSTLDGVTGGAASKFKGLKGSVSSVITSFKSLKVAIIATGIGALLIGILAVGKAFTSSEEGQNKFAKLMGVIGSITGNLIDILANLGEKIIWVFENPKKAIKDFTQLIKDNIINRFNGLLELIPQLGKSINQLFKGDFAGAGETAANAVAKITLGTNNLTQSIKDAGKALGDFGKEVAEDAKKAADIADKRAKADKIERNLLIQRAEANRKIADLRFKSEQRDLFSASERVAFLKEASKIEEDITNKEIYAAQLRANAKTLENTLSKSTKEDLDEEAQLKAKVIELDTSKLNLQKRLQTSIITFQNEEKAGIKAISDAKQKDIDDQKKIDEEKIENDKKLEQKRLDDIDAIQKEYKIKKENEEAESELQKLELQKTRELQRLETLNATEEQKALVISFWDNEITEQKKKNSDEELRKTKENNAKKLADEKAVNDAKIAMARNAFGNIAQALGKESKAGKAAAAAASLINTYQGITAELATKTATPFGFALKLANIAATAAIGFKSVKNILSTNVKNPTAKSVGGGGSGRSEAQAPQAQAPQFNIVGQSSENQLATAISGQTQKPIKAYVVSNDVTTAQSMDRNIVRGAAIG